MTQLLPERGIVPPLTLGWRIQMALGAADMTIEGIADELGVSRSTIGRWCNDRGHPTRGYLKLIAMRTGVSYDWLTTGHVDSPQRGGDGASGLNGIPSLTVIDNQGYGFWAGLLPFDAARSRKPMGSRPPTRVSAGSDISRLRRTLDTHPIVSRRKEDNDA